jgi:hypothetical protein
MRKGSEVLFEEDRWKVVQTVEDPEYCEIMHDCDEQAIEFTYCSAGQEKCYGCQAKVPEKITTLCSLYSKGALKTRFDSTHFDNVMKQVFWKMYKESPIGMNHSVQSDVTEPDK